MILDSFFDLILSFAKRFVLRRRQNIKYRISTT